MLLHIFFGMAFTKELLQLARNNFNRQARSYSVVLRVHKGIILSMPFFDAVRMQNSCHFCLEVICS